MTTTSLLMAVLAAGVFAAAFGWAIARVGPVDPVKARSSHERPTPTSGGLALVAGAAVGLALTDQGGVAAWTLAIAAGLGFAGAADDLWDFGPLAKAAAHAAAAAAIVAVVGPATILPLLGGYVPIGPGLGAIGSVLFLLVLLNAVNFMDGANGLAPGACVIALLGLSVAGFAVDDPAVGAAALAGAAAGLGFLPWNVSGRVFQGDAGALFSAALIGGLGLRLASTFTATPYLVVFCVLPLLVDVLLTLLVRARRRAPLTEAHREHLYQLWLQATGQSHGALAWRVWALCAVCAATGLWLELYAEGWALPGLLTAVAVLSAGWVRLRRTLTRRG